MTSNTRAGDRILGSLRSAEGTGIARIEAALRHSMSTTCGRRSPIHAVSPAGSARCEGELRLGGEFRAHFFASGWQGTGRVEACEPPQRLLVLTKDADEPDAPVEHPIEA